MANVWDANGHKIGEVRDSGNGQNTYDKNGQPAGKVRDNGTYDNQGHKISWDRDPGLTIRREK
jgi:YD repeat-containing protein